MTEPLDIPAWIALFTGLYALATAVGELRQPGMWMALVEDMERNTGVRLLTGLVCVALGATIYLASQWRPGDWLSILISALGGICLAEGLLILAAGDRFLRFARSLLIRARTFWPGLAALVGAGLIFAALSRL